MMVPQKIVDRHPGSSPMAVSTSSPEQSISTSVSTSSFTSTRTVTSHATSISTFSSSSSSSPSYPSTSPSPSPRECSAPKSSSGVKMKTQDSPGTDATAVRKKNKLVKILRRLYWKSVEFKYVKVAQLVCGVYILLVTFTYAGQLGVFGGARDPSSGYIIDPNLTQNTSDGIIEFYDTRTSTTFTRAIVAMNRSQMILLALSRFSGFFMYPAIVLVFWSKFRALQTFLANTPFGIFCISDTHRLHVYCGWIIFIDGCLHTVCHLVRWALQGNLNLLLDSRSGLTGLIVIVCTVMIVLPMSLLKHVIKFEIRKYLHYLFWIFALAMCFHAPLYALPNGGFCALVFPTLMIVYAFDAFYAKAFMSERVHTVKYQTVKTGTQLSMQVSKSFTSRLHSGGYVYICFDWLNKHQWHAFSIYEGPVDKSERRLFIANNGDWTESVHRNIQDRSTAPSLLVSGPFPSPYANAEQYDNLILVASGIGITPALSAIQAFRDSRRVNLVWATRDVSQLVFFLQNSKLDQKGFNVIFYTGSDPLPDSIEKRYSGATNLSIIKSRPNLWSVLVNIIAYNDKQNMNKHKFDVLNVMNDEELGFDKDYRENHHTYHSVSLKERVAELVSYANGLGYDLTGLAEIVQKKMAVEQNRRRSSKSQLLPSLSFGDDVDAEDLPFVSTGIEDEFSKTLLRNDIERSDGWSPSTRSSSSPSVRIWEDDAESFPYLKQRMKDNADDDDLGYLRESWGLMYCGARNKLLSICQEVSKELNIPLHQEAFDW